MPGVPGCLQLTSGKWSPVFPKCGPVLFYPVRSCPMMSCPVLSCPFSALTWYVVSCVFIDVCFVFLQFLLVLFPYFSVDTFSVCLVFSQSVFVFLFYKWSGSHVHFCPRPCFEHLSTVQACIQTQRTALYVRSVFSRPLCFVAKGLGSLQKLAQAAEHRYGQLPNSQLHTRATSALLGNRKSQRAMRPCPCLSESLLLFHPFLCGVQTVSHLFHGCAVFPAAAPHVDGSAQLQMITVHTFASGSNAKMFGISATTSYVVWTSAACALMFCHHREKSDTKAKCFFVGRSSLQ